MKNLALLSIGLAAVLLAACGGVRTGTLAPGEAAHPDVDIQFGT